MINVSNDIFNEGKAITPSNTDDHDWPFDAIHVGGAGNIVVVQENDVAVTLTGCLAGHVYRLRGKRVNSTSTTATNMTGLRYK